MKIPWVLFVVAAALTISMPWSVFGWAHCKSDDQFGMLLLEAALSVATLIATIIQHARTPAGTSRTGQAITLYVFSGLLIVWLPMALLLIAFGSDAC